ncbi:hypothetical protein O6H91_07G006800 [Diphasiastrum complanatum]|uniref:Uncharacterized protein n=1 Tax=Diphasiastrum complanatum TaxID=34168 RepID=A0ACC2D2W4_DIPCM|nr:hypothetical protein O6H91_07G006800 [Diphasiastrum complanatum]
MLMYGFEPRSPIALETRTIKFSKVADFLHDMQEMLQIARENVQSAQDRDRHYVNLKRSPRDFQVGDWVYLRILKDSSVKRTGKHYKLSPRYRGPFKILKKIGSLAYQLELPDGSQVHPVFHVSHLKKSLREGEHLGSKDQLRLEPEKILDTRTKRLRNRIVTEHLVRWRGCTDDDDSWEQEGSLRRNFPNFKF